MYDTLTPFRRGRQWLPLLFAFLNVAAPEARADQLGTLAIIDGASQDFSGIIADDKGLKLNVQLRGRTLYRDGYWNTLCLPFSLTPTELAASPLAGATIMELDALQSLLDADGLLTLTFTGATAIEAGKPYIVKWPVALTISSTADWNTFATNVALGTTYENQVVKLAADIDVESSYMVGSSGKFFKGTFDGCGHTINCNIDYTGGNGAAPFLNIMDATILNVKVAGSVNGGSHCAGLVGYASGTNSIKHCEVAATVTSTGANCGGVLGHGQASATTISNCLFSGTITGNGNSAKVGIIYGWSDTGGTGTIINCLAGGTYSGYGGLDMMLGNGTMAADGCYKTQNAGTYGTYTTATGESLASTLGTASWTTADGRAVPQMNATSGVESPTFSSVTIDATDLSCTFGSGDTSVRFLGTYDNKSFSAADKSILFLGGANTLYYPTASAAIGPCRAYFKIGDGDAKARQVTAFNLNFGEGDTQGIIDAEANSSSFTLHSSFKEAWYTLDGRRLPGKPAQKGVYIYKGVKRVVK